MKTRLTALVLALGFVACGDEDALDDTAADSQYAQCMDLGLPDCPPECPDDYAASCGEPCDTEGEACGNTIGDGRVCSEGTWQCSVHAPLEPEGCNWVCWPY